MGSRSGHTLTRDSTRGAHALLERANVCRTIAGMQYMPTARVKSLEALVQFKVAGRESPLRSTVVCATALNYDRMRMDEGTGCSL